MNSFKSLQRLIVFSALALLTAFPAWAGDDGFDLDIWPDKIKIEVGQQVQFQAQLTDSTGQLVQAQFQWSLKKGSSFGSLSDAGLFTGENPGKAEIEVMAVGYNKKEDAEIEVVLPGTNSSSNDDDKSHDSSHTTGNLILRLMPGKVELSLSQSFQFNLLVTGPDGSAVDTTVSWSVKNDFIGSINQQGEFTAKNYGETYIVATIGLLSVKAKVEVENDVDDHHLQSGKYLINVNPAKVELEIGSTAQFTVSVTDSNGTPVDTTVTWSLEGWPIGEVDSTGLFTAAAYGEAYIIASVGSNIGRAKLEVERLDNHRDDDQHHGASGQLGFLLNLSPRDTVVYVGDAIQFKAEVVDSNGTILNSNFEWELEENKNAGTLDQNGYFMALKPGLTFVKVEAGEFKSKTSIQVMSRDMTNQTNQIRIQRVLPNGVVMDDSLMISEGGVFKLDGFPYPFDILNGGLITFPDGALHEDILLSISLSELTEVDSDSVYYNSDILGAIEFEVWVNGAVVHPYYFDKPLRISLPYQPEILKQRGINPDSLDIAYFLSQDFFEKVGIANVVIDTVQNRVFAEVVHFSTLAIVHKSTVSGISNETLIPSDLTLYQNYPNPFNPETTIRYQLPAQGYIEVKVFNTLGNEVKSLFSGVQQAGLHSIRWNGTDNFNNKVSSGLYFYQVKSQSQLITKRMLLMK